MGNERPPRAREPRDIAPVPGACSCAVLFLVATCAVLLVACGDDERPALGVGPGSWMPGHAPDPCATPHEGCACDEPEAVAPCGRTVSRTAATVTCELGERTCEDGLWSACVPSRMSVRAFSPSVTHGFRPQGLAPSSRSCDEPCDPFCRTVDDTPDGLSLGPGLDSNADGVTLTQGENAGNCSALSITPASATLTVTAINADGTLVVSPSQSVMFAATCDASGAVVTPSWSLDAYDRAVVDQTGRVTVFSGTAGPLRITASNALTSTTATLDVAVNIQEQGSSSTVAAAFLGTGPPGSGKTLYPYAGTIFPLDLKAPLVQWMTGGNPATDVEVGLRYPSGASTPTFSYSRIYNGGPPKNGTLDPTMPAWRPPQEVWTAFGRTAARGATASARTADIVVQRRYSGTVHGELVIPVTFATEPLRGTVYYTQYLRTLFTPSSGTSVCSGQADLNPSTYSPGFVCPVGNCTHPGTSGTSSTRAIDLSSPTATNVDPFNNTAGCPVCHSVSADGQTYVSGNQFWQTSGGGTSRGIDAIGLTTGSVSSFMSLDEAPSYASSGNDFDANWPTEQSRGFAYSALSPDGSLALQGASFWGNTANTPASNNTQDATLKGVSGGVKPYFAISTHNPGFGVMFATTGALSSNTLSSGTLSASSNGTLTIDGVTMAVGYSVLVKNETGTNAKKNGVYSVTSAGSSSAKWQLKRRNDADTNGEIVAAMDVRVSDGSSNRGRVFYVTTSGSISINTTSLNFAQRTAPTFPSMMVPSFSPDGQKVVYVNADKDPISGYPDTGWRRGLSMFDFDTDTLTISQRKRLLNTYSSTSAGTPMKWPFFESDSRSVVYVETDPNEFCSSNSPGTSTALARACQEAAYGSMSPTTRGYWPGKIYSIDSRNPAGTRVQLAKLTNGEDTNDYAKSYQPTVLPFAVGGYRWAIFTSPRAYGNQFNARASAGSSTTGTPTDFSCAASMLWVAAIDDITADGTDRSHPAFFLPGQNSAPITSENHYVNERGYLVPSLCKDPGESCTLSTECCGGSDSPATSACRVASGWTPADGTPQRTCQHLSGSCASAGDSCDASADCCAGGTCVNFTCTAPPSYDEASFSRDYEAECGSGELPSWTLFSFHLATPSDTTISFEASTAAAQEELDAAKRVSLGESTSTVESPALPETRDVGSALTDASVSGNLAWLRVTITLSPSSDGLATPVLEDWQMSYDCVPAQ